MSKNLPRRLWNFCGIVGEMAMCSTIVMPRCSLGRCGRTGGAVVSGGGEAGGRSSDSAEPLVAPKLMMVLQLLLGLRVRVVCTGTWLTKELWGVR